MGPDLTGSTLAILRAFRPAAAVLLATVTVLAGSSLIAPVGSGPAPVQAAGLEEVTILAGDPSTLDPAVTGDAGSASTISQLFEGLTALDPSLTIRPALAERWEVLEGGQRIVFHLRPGITFSDGTPITGDDVVRSWFRLISPAAKSPLASLLSDVEGATAYGAGWQVDPSAVGLHAEGATVEVRLLRPASDFLAITAGPSLAIVPPGTGTDAAVLEPGSFVGSGGYVLSARTATELTLTANDSYWAGPPEIRTIHLLTTLGGRSPVAAFQDGDLDYTGISSYDASWIAFDPVLGPQLRRESSLGLDYYGFDTRRAPFNKPEVRRAFAQAVNWKRLVALSNPDNGVAATGMVPAGIPGKGNHDFGPVYDPDAARAALAAAGYPGGVGFPRVTLVTGGTVYDEAVLAELKANLGIEVAYETMDFGAYFRRLSVDPPQFWELSWIADYPGPSDFLRILLGTGQGTNYGRWGSTEFDDALAEAGSTTDPDGQRTAYERAEAIVQRDAPAIPVSYGKGFALSRTGLLGATDNGLGIIRFAGLAWQP